MKNKILISISCLSFAALVVLLLIGFSYQSENTFDKAQRIEEIMVLEEKKAELQRNLEDTEKNIIHKKKKKLL